MNTQHWVAMGKKPRVEEGESTKQHSSARGEHITKACDSTTTPRSMFLPFKQQTAFHLRAIEEPYHQEETTMGSGGLKKAWNEGGESTKQYGSESEQGKPVTVPTPREKAKDVSSMLKMNRLSLKGCS